MLRINREFITEVSNRLSFKNIENKSKKKEKQRRQLAIKAQPSNGIEIIFFFLPYDNNAGTNHYIITCERIVCAILCLAILYRDK